MLLDRVTRRAESLGAPFPGRKTETPSPSQVVGAAIKLGVFEIAFLGLNNCKVNVNVN